MNFWATEAPADRYFEQRLGAWVLSRYRDVAAALRDPSLVPALARSTTPAVPLDDAGHAEFRTQALRALSPTMLQEWERQFVVAANAMVGELPTGEAVDLVDRFARPWSLQVAAIAARVASDQCERLAGLARCVFEAACEPYDADLAVAAQRATVELATFFRHSPPWFMQMFIALAHSLPAFLGNAWLALLEQPVDIVDFPKAVDELLRFAGPAKAQFRQAVAPKDARFILRLDIANRDPDEFPEPHKLCFDRRVAGHLALGTGVHACVGSVLIKSAASVATKALFDRFRFQGMYSADPVDSFAVRYVRSLQVTLLPTENAYGVDPSRA